MSRSPPDAKLVYLALRGVLQGQDVYVRQEKKVRRLIERQRDHAEVKHLIQEYGMESLCQTAKALLKDQIFVSTLEAKKRFPEVFEVSPDQTAERAISASEAARNEDAAIQSVTEGSPDMPDILEDQPTAIIPQAPQCALAITNHTQPPPNITASLYPVYLPFSVQHRLLARVQAILEAACYTFAHKRLPAVLQRKKWTCPESAELNKWSRILLTHRDQLNQSIMHDLGKSLSDLCTSIAQLRHTAVHRLQLTANRTLQFIIDAETLVKLLRDDVSLAVVSAIRSLLQTCIGEIERNKDLLELSMATTKARFAAEREALERREREALESTVSEDREYTVFAGESLEQALNAPIAGTGGYGKGEDEDEEEGGGSSETDVDDHGGYEFGVEEKIAE